MAYGRRRPQARKPARKYKKRRVYRKAPVMGMIRVVRKLPEIYIRNSASLGIPQNNDPTGTCIVLGTPVADAVGGTYSVPFSMTFRLDQIINSNDITNLCDSYKIGRVNVKVMYQQSQAPVNSAALMPNFSYIVDHDDNAAPTINSLREKMGCRTTTFGMNRAISINVSPRIADTVYNNGVTSAYAVSKPLWINSTYPGAEHYGIKGCFHQVNLASTATINTAFKFDVTTTLYGKDLQ